MAETKSRSRKSIRLPREGDFLTDGTRLVEVVGKDRQGVRVLDVMEPAEADLASEDPRAVEVLPVKVGIELWRVVIPEQETVDAA